MVKMIKKLFYFLVFILLSCGNDDSSEVENDFKGYYKIKSIHSETPIDLNNDNIKSQDYLQEIKSDFIQHDGEVMNYGYNPNDLSYYADVRPLSHQTNAAKLISFNFPVQVIDSLFMGNDTYINILLHYKTIFSYVGYELLNNGEVHLDNASLEYVFNFNNANFVHFKRTNQTTFELVLEKEVYDFSEENWINTRLTSVYEKVELE